MLVPDDGAFTESAQTMLQWSMSDIIDVEAG